MKEAAKANVYLVVVDYAISVEEMIKKGHYNRTNDDITSKSFPTARSEKTETAIELIHFNRSISTKDALKELDQMGYRPANLHQLLALGAKYPDLQKREFPIVALESVWRRPLGSRFVPYLCRDASGRCLDLYWLRIGWFEDWRFAAVRK